MLIKIILATCLVAVFVNGVPFDNGNAATHLSRIQRSPQQPNFAQFPNIVPPAFDNSQIVSQHTDSNKNGFAQTTIYKSDNGYGASSVSVSKSGASSTMMSTGILLTLLAILSVVCFSRK